MKSLYQDREISTLSFNERVLQEAEDKRNPLMERLWFLGIFSSNMDEFFKVRVASIHRLMELGAKGKRVILEVVGAKAAELDGRFQEAYRAITSQMAGEGLRILGQDDLLRLGPDSTAWLSEYFKAKVLPSLVPLVLDRRQPFPQLEDGVPYFAVEMKGRVPRNAILQIPSELPRFVELPNSNIMYLDDVIRLFLDEIFYIFDYASIAAYEFKILRDAELDMDNDFSEDYVLRMKKEIEQRKGGRPTRLVYDDAMPPPLLGLLLAELQLGESDPLIGSGRYHNMRDLMQFPANRPDLSFQPSNPAPHPVLDLQRTPMLETMSRQDILVTYPYQSFDHIIRLLREAAIDPLVDAIRISLYRVAPRSQVVNALVNAARNGKSVFVSIELQARFDEKNNIKIAERLSEAGATVIFGVPPMKVHCKLLLIEREGKRYACLSTGNFNELTGKNYVDSTLLTVHPKMTAEVERVFDFLEQATHVRMFQPPKFKHLLVSPFNSRRVIGRLIERERGKGKRGYVFLKVNHLTDLRIIRKIRRAADAGVQIDLIVRTTFAMLPHKNIRAISILDRFLEHQRVYIFGRKKDQYVFLSSSDLMERNLDWRVEVAFPIYDKALRKEIVDLMSFQLNDTCKARVLDARQTNPYAGNGAPDFRAQEETSRYMGRLFEDAEALQREKDRAREAKHASQG